jgi:hypothetical protein
VTAVKVLPIPVAISRLMPDWTIDPNLPEFISFAQLQQAAAMWFAAADDAPDSNTPKVVPLTGGAEIDLSTIQDLIAYWLTNSSVHDPLP